MWGLVDMISISLANWNNEIMLKENYTTQQNTRSWSGKYFFKSLIWVWNWTRMLKDYSHGQALIVLEGIGMIAIYRNDFYRKTKGEQK